MHTKFIVWNKMSLISLHKPLIRTHFHMCISKTNYYNGKPTYIIVFKYLTHSSDINKDLD